MSLRLGDTIVAGAISDTSAFATKTELAGKVNTSDLVECHTVIETYQNGANWYRLYDDGWVEQGGTVVATTTWQTVTFPIEMANNLYTANCTNTAGGTNGNGIRNKTATDMQIYQNWQWDWEVKGYAAE